MQILKRKKLWMFAVLAMVMFVAMAAGNAEKVSAATTGWVQESSGAWSYYSSEGSKAYGWKLINNKYYYLDTRTGYMKTGWAKIGSKWYYFQSNGVMVTGWKEISGKWYYMKSNGYMTTGWANIDNKWYYLKSNGAMATGWQQIGNNWFYLKSNGTMATGWQKINSKWYYLNAGGSMRTGWAKIGNNWYYLKSSGVMATGWQQVGNNWYYLNSGGSMKTGWLQLGSRWYYLKSNGAMVTGDYTINGKVNSFSSSGVWQGVTEAVSSGSNAKTLKGFLTNALVPVGNTMYVYGGWDNATTKGRGSTWTSYYNTGSGSSNSRLNGLDCSGFVGWTTYNTMQTKSGVGSGYTVVASDVVNSYVSWGFGSKLTQASLSSSGYTLKAGDVGCTSGHTWIVIGQCSDKSAVIVHAPSTGQCVKIAGTPTPGGNSSSQAVALAQKYMNGSYSAAMNKLNLSCYGSQSYITGCNYLRWNRSTLADPEGYSNMTADQILKDLFGY